VFVTGTDTDCGKTFVTAGILNGFVSMGIDAAPAKPVQTGCRGGVSEDLEFSLKTAKLSFPEEVKNRLCPNRFTPACSPHLAAELNGSSLSAAAMASDLKELQSRFQCVVAEGAGGILVPLGGGKTMLDLMVLLNWPVVLVSSDKLGTINHTLLSLEALRQAEIDVAGVVVNHAVPPSPLISKSNTETIRKYGRTEILAEISYSPDCFPAESFAGVCEKLKGILS
jgi:dethiobiotin synthase